MMKFQQWRPDLTRLETGSNLELISLGNANVAETEYSTTGFLKEAYLLICFFNS